MDPKTSGEGGTLDMFDERASGVRLACAVLVLCTNEQSDPAGVYSTCGGCEHRLSCAYITYLHCSGKTVEEISGAGKGGGVAVEA